MVMKIHGIIALLTLSAAFIIGLIGNRNNDPGMASTEQCVSDTATSTSVYSDGSLSAPAHPVFPTDTIIDIPT